MWPTGLLHRQQVWEMLTRARAMENQAYVLGVNRVGTDGLGVDHLGGTCAIDPVGEVMRRLDNKPGIQTVTLGSEKVKEFQERDFRPGKMPTVFQLILGVRILSNHIRNHRLGLRSLHESSSQ